MKKFKPLSDKESELAEKLFYEGLPGVYGVRDCIDEMLKKLHDKGIIVRAVRASKA